MRNLFVVLLIAGALALGGCQSTIDLKTTPEYQQLVEAKAKGASRATGITIIRNMARKYDPTYDAFDEAYWSALIAYATQYDKGKISQEQFEALDADADAVRVARRRGVVAAEDAAYQARRAANRSYTCTNTRTGVYCY